RPGRVVHDRGRDPADERRAGMRRGRGGPRRAAPHRAAEHRRTARRGSRARTGHRCPRGPGPAAAGTAASTVPAAGAPGPRGLTRSLHVEAGPADDTAGPSGAAGLIVTVVLPLPDLKPALPL